MMLDKTRLQEFATLKYCCTHTIAPPHQLHAQAVDMSLDPSNDRQEEIGNHTAGEAPSKKSRISPYIHFETTKQLTL